MSAQRKLRTATKWLATAAALLLAGGFFVSLRRDVFWTSPSARHQVGLNTGGLNIVWRPVGWNGHQEAHPVQPKSSVTEHWHEFAMPMFWPFAGSNRQGWVWIDVPLWLAILPAGALAISLWYSGRRETGDALWAFCMSFVPIARTRVTMEKVIGISMLHGLATMLLGVLIGTVVVLLDQPQRSAIWDAWEVLNNLLLYLVLIPSPIYGFVWAWAFTKWQNKQQNRLYGHFCPACTYDLRGNVSGVCPECGTPIEESMVRRLRELPERELDGESLARVEDGAGP